MTYMKTQIANITLSAMTLGCVALLPASAMADEKTAETVTAESSFNVALTTDGVVKSGVKAYRKGDFEKSIALHNAAIRGRMSKRKTAVAQSNICASWAMIGDLSKAEEACEAALELRPDYAPALANMELLNIKLAQK